MTHPTRLVGLPQSFIMSAQGQSILPQLNHNQRQELLVYLLFAVLLLLMALSARIAYQYMLPQPRWVQIGNISEFRQDQPVLVDLGKINVWVINRADRINVFHTKANGYQECKVRLDDDGQTLVDPCWGTHYTFNGIYIQGPPPSRMLDHYAVRVATDGTLAIETTQPILGMSFEQFWDECAARVNAPTWQNTWTWLQFCPIEEITPLD